MPQFRPPALVRSGLAYVRLVKSAQRVLPCNGDRVGFLAHSGAGREPNGERQGKDSNADAGALEQALEHEHRDTSDSRTGGPESYHRDSTERGPDLRSKTLVVLDLSFRPR